MPEKMISRAPYLDRLKTRDTCRYPLDGIWQKALETALDFEKVWASLLCVRPEQIRPPYQEEYTLIRLISALDAQIFVPELVHSLLLSEEYAESHLGAIEYIRRRQSLSDLCGRWDETLKRGRENIAPRCISNRIFYREALLAL